MLAALTAGLLTGLSLIVAIGAQNAHVLRQGLARDHVGVVVAICTLSDVVLILAGVAGIGTVVEKAPWALEVVRWVGVAFLVWYAVGALRRARAAESLHAEGGARRTVRGLVGLTVALTWLNPHVYLDTVLLLGTVANQHGHVDRWWFAGGAAVASALWFGALGYGARLLGPLLARPRAWQVLDVLIGITMLAVAAGLAFG